MNKDIRDTSVEQGWKSMQSMLDAEMPRKKQRRPLIWWWLLAASVAGTASLWKYSSPSVEPANNPAPQQQDVSAPMASLTPAGKVNQPADAGSKPPENITVRRLASAVSHERSEIVALSNGLNEEETETKYGQIAYSDSSSVRESGSHSAHDVPVMTPLDQVTTEIVSTVGGRQILQPVGSDENPCRVTNYKKGRAGIAATAITGRSLAGASLGFIYTRNTGKKVALRGGLSMAVYIPDTETRPVLLFSDQDYLAATNYDFKSSDQFGNTVVSQDVFTQGGQFVEVPVERWMAAELTAMVQYKLTRKLWLQAGAVGVLAARSVISPLNYTGGTVLQPDESALNSLESLAGPVSRKFTTDCITGISWFSGRHIEWGLNLRLPLRAGNFTAGKSADSMMTASNSAADEKNITSFTGSSTSPLFTTSAIWNF